MPKATERYDEITENLQVLGDRTLSLQHATVETERKLDRSLVSKVDRDNERDLAEIIRSCFPNDSIRGEEGTSLVGASPYSWLIDPIDGTRQFVKGQPFWGILLARVFGGRPVFGAMYHPLTRSVIWAEQGAGCFQSFSTPDPDVRLKVSQTGTIPDAYLLHNGLAFAKKAGAESLLSALCDEVDAERGYADSFGHIEVISGRADIMLDCLPEPHDVAAAAVCVTEAGGAWLSISDQPPSSPGKVTITTNEALAGELCDRLRREGGS